MVSSSGETCHPCRSNYLAEAYGGIILISRPTFMDISISSNTTSHSSFHHLHTHTHMHTHTHTNYIYIYIYIHILLCMSAQEHVTSTTRGEQQKLDIWHTSGCHMVDVPCLDHLWDGMKDPLDVRQVRCFQQETPRKMHHCMLLGLSW